MQATLSARCTLAHRAISRRTPAATRRAAPLVVVRAQQQVRCDLSSLPRP